MNGLTFVTARFSNNERTTVEVTWEDPEKNLVATYHEAIEGDAAWEEILTHIGLDSIHENTYKYIKNTQLEVRNLALEIAKDHNLIGNVAEMAKHIFKEFDPEKDKELLFTYKINLFSLELIKNCTDKTLKSKLRKAKTIIEATSIACQMAESTLATNQSSA